MKRIHAPILILFCIGSLLSMVAADCTPSTGNTGSGTNPNKALVYLGFKGSGALAGKPVEGSVTFFFGRTDQINPQSSHTTYSVIAEPGGTYSFKKAFTLDAKEYEFMLVKDGWTSPRYTRTLLAGKQTHIIWTVGSLAAPEVFTY